MRCVPNWCTVLNRNERREIVPHENDPVNSQERMDDQDGETSIDEENEEFRR